MITTLERTACRLDLLTPREQRVLTAMASGLSNQGIGAHLNLSPKTVEAHVGSVFVKLGLYTKATENRRVLAVLAWLDEQDTWDRPRTRR